MEIDNIKFPLLFCRTLVQKLKLYSADIIIPMCIDFTLEAVEEICDHEKIINYRRPVAATFVISKIKLTGLPATGNYLFIYFLNILRGYINLMKVFNNLNLTLLQEKMLIQWNPPKSDIL